MLGLHIFIFIASCFLLFWSGNLLIASLMRIAKFLGWREFIVAFFVMAVGGSTPNLFVGITSALQKIPQLSFGDVMGGNLVDLTLTAALAILISKKELPAKSRTVQTTSIFTIIIAVLPFLLILDGILGRIDGIILILAFMAYVFWLFSKTERFTRIYNTDKVPLVKEFPYFLKDVGKLILGILFLLLAAQGIVTVAYFFAETLNLSLALVGILIVGIGNALPETYFAVASARKNQTWMILGSLMGSVIVSATLVLGFVALVCPIEIINLSSFAIARFFLIISALFFFFSVKTDRKITRKEAIGLFLIYTAFVIVELLVK